MKTPIDLNLLYVAESLYRTLNVSKTASELGMSQSAVSHALQRLRDQLGDSLFVRGSKGVRPTKRALDLRDGVMTLVNNARTLSLANTTFDPKKQATRIVVATSDYVEVLLLPKLIKVLKAEAPHLQISIRPTGGDLPKQELENGIYDLAIAGFYEHLPEGFYQSNFFSDKFATAYRKDHPSLRGDISTDEFFEHEHALITLQGDFNDKLSQKFGKDGPRRKFRHGSYSFTGMAWTLAQSDLILTAPLRLLQEYKKYFPIVIKDPPYAPPPVTMKMVWHASTHKDSLRKWFRDLLKTLIKET